MALSEKPLRIVVAPDSLKGGPSSSAVAEAIAYAWQRSRPQDSVVQIPLADGGEGTLDVLELTVEGSRRHQVDNVVGPDGRPGRGSYLLLPGGCAVVELASVSGLVGMSGLDPLGATSRGVGVLIGAALDAGASAILLALGGSASTDGGAGALAALGAQFFDDAGDVLSDGGGALTGLARIDLTALRPAPPEGIELLADVDNPLLGPNGAAAIYGPQKGATEEDIILLEGGLAKLASHLGRHYQWLPGAGAAGGVAFGFMAAWGARLSPGSARIAGTLGLDEALQSADMVISAEGRLDQTSMRGKVVSEVINLARRSQVDVAIIAGSVASDFRLNDVRIVSLTEIAGSTTASMADPLYFVGRACYRLALA